MEKKVQGCVISHYSYFLRSYLNDYYICLKGNSTIPSVQFLTNLPMSEMDTNSLRSKKKGINYSLKGLQLIAELTIGESEAVHEGIKLYARDIKKKQAK